MIRRIKPLLIVSLIIIIASIWLAGCSREIDSAERKNDSKTVQTQIFIVKMEDVPMMESIMGTIVSRNQANVSSKIMGTIQSILVNEGDFVKSGQALVRIDNRDLKPNVDKARAGLQEINNALTELDKVEDELIASQQSAQASYDFASTSLSRYQNLYNRQAISREMLDETLKQYKLAEANLKASSAKKGGLIEKRKQILSKKEQGLADLQLANVYLNYAVIQSPISGYVTRKYMDIGSMAVPGQPILQIESPEYRFEVNVKESLYPYLKIGQKTTIHLDSMDQSLEGTITEIVPKTDPKSRSFVVKIDLAGFKNIRSGLYGTAEFSMGMEPRLLIPSNAIKEKGSLTGVYALDTGNYIQFRLVKTGKSINENVEILTGLNINDRLVISELDNISAGMKVEGIE